MRYKLLIDLPLFTKGAIYQFDWETGFVYREEKEKIPMQYPLRTGLSGYLWLLMSEKKYMRRLK